MKKPQTPQNTRNVVLKRAHTMYRTSNTNPTVLVDSVILYHDGALMYCDSALLDEAKNTFDAFGHVRINQGDTIILTGDYLHYDGVFRLAEVRKNVVLKDLKAGATLFTDSLNYDRMMNIAYYFDGGMVVDSANELTSYWGQYEPNLKLATFSDSVKLVNDRFVIHADTMQYEPQTRVATLMGPSVVESDSGTIYTSKGWYNTTTDESKLFNQSLVVNIQRTSFLVGDTIYFNRAKMIGDVYGHMIMQDTIRKVILTGNRGHYDGKLRYAWATNHAQAMEYSQKDTLFLHADSLKMVPDSTFSLLKAFHKARFYRVDIQGIGDSIQYSSQDSIMHLFRDAVVWNENNQISGDTIHVFRNDSTVDSMIVKQNAFIMQRIDSLKYDQVKGRTISAYMNGKQMDHVFVDGSAESIFYPQEKDKSFIGLNKTESSYLSVAFRDKKVVKLKLWPAPIAKMTPLPEVTHAMLYLKNVFWLDYLRPHTKEDIFKDTKRKAGDVAPKHSKRFYGEN